MKKCRKCGVELVAGENQYPSCAKRGSHICKKCISAQGHQYYKENSEAAKERARRWRQANPEKVKAARARFHKKHPDRKKEASDRYCAANADKLKEAGARYRAANPEKVKAAQARFHKKHPDRKRATCARYRQANTEKVKEYNARYRKANPDKIREQARRRNALKRGSTIEPVDEAAIYDLYNSTCLYCGATDNLTLDHVVPLFGKGPHCEDNLVVACGRCNSSKGVKPLENWLQTQPRAHAWLY